MDPVIQAENIDIIYNLGKSNEYRASQNINFEIYPREYVILFGPSGCGKSTLMYNILGALPNTAGELIVKGEKPYTFDSTRLVDYQRYTVGIIYQAFYLIPSLSVLDNVMLPQIFAGVKATEREKRGIDLLRRFGVEAQAHKLPLNLSGGQQQRVAVARSIVNDPEILLADEPVGNLDSHSADQVMEMLDAINYKEKKTVILITHDAKYLPYAHRVFYLKDGKLLRIVANPEKVQIKKIETGKTIITELEKLARIYPYSSPDELKVKSIVNYLTQDQTFEQLEKIEKSVKEIVEGRMDEATFFNTLSSPLATGGAGVSSGVAHTMTKKMSEVLDESMDVRRFRKWIEDKAEEVDNVEHSTDQQKYVRRLRTYLLDELDSEISMGQLKRLEKAIENRLSGVMRKDDFQKHLATSLERGGVGFRGAAARRLTLHFEKLIAQATVLTRT